MLDPITKHKDDCWKYDMRQSIFKVASHPKYDHFGEKEILQ